MSQKRTLAEVSNDDQTNEDSDVIRQLDNAKREKFASFNDTTIQDIPTEILQCILVKAISMEVQNMKLAKFVWKEKADLVISRLRTVCSQWSSVLTTDFFQIALHRTLDGIAEQEIRMETFHDSIVKYSVAKVTTLKDEILMLCQHEHQDSVTSLVYYSTSIAVYDRNNMKVVKEVIALAGVDNKCMAACNVSNCVYVLDINEELHCTSILRIARDEEQKFNIQTWISDLRFPLSSGTVTVSEKGSIGLVVILRPDGPGPTAVTVYNPNVFLQHEVILSPDIYGFGCIETSVIEKSNGNLVLALVNREHQMVLTEIDTDGVVQRQHKSSLRRRCCMNFADTSGRILIIDWDGRMELLDSEFNLLEFTGPRPKQNDFEYLHCLHFNSERNEVLGIGDCVKDNADACLLRIFRFREEEKPL